MPEVISAPLMSLSEREIGLICNIHRVELKQFKPIELKHDALFNELQKNNDKIRGRVNLQPLHNYRMLNNIYAFDITYIREILKAECLDKSYFEWVNTDNDRLCNFVWAYIKCAKEKVELVTEIVLPLGDNINTNNSRLEKTLYTPPETIIKENTYGSLGSLQDAFRFIEQNPINNKIIKHNVISFFDTWNVSLSEKEKNIKDLENPDYP